VEVVDAVTAADVDVPVVGIVIAVVVVATEEVVLVVVVVVVVDVVVELPHDDSSIDVTKRKASDNRIIPLFM
jgi:uncharacterized metal-binding protein